jgi:hypothetical protein
MNLTPFVTEKLVVRLNLSAQTAANAGLMLLFGLNSRLIHAQNARVRILSEGSGLALAKPGGSGRAAGERLFLAPALL